MNEISSIIQTIAYALPLPHWIALAAVLLTSVTITRRNTKHAQFQREAMRQLKALLKCKTPQEKFYLLRKTNPFVFEEMILTAFKKKGYKIIRNKRYTGDGGIDGKVYIDKKLHLIQAKRYKDHINLAHIKEFHEICSKQNAYGLFIHTGKTGAKSKQEAINTNQGLISGKNLLTLLDLNSDYIGLNNMAKPPRRLEDNLPKIVAYSALILTGITISLYFSSVIYFLLNGWDAEQVSPWSIFTYMKYLHAPYGAYLAISLIIPNLIIAAMVAMLIFKPEETNSRWAKTHDLKKANLLQKHGILLGKINSKFLINDDNTHVLVTAPTGSGKGVGIVIPNLLAWSDSIICLDVKGENHRLTSGYREKLKHKVINFTPFNEENKSHCYNPLDYISTNPHKRITDLQIVANILIASSVKSDPHFPEEARDLFVGLALYVLDHEDFKSTVGSVFRLLGTEAPLHEILEHVAKNYPDLDEASRQLFNTFSQKAEKERSGIKSTLGRALMLWRNPVIDAVTSKSDFSFHDLRKRRHAIYIGVKVGEMKTLSPLIRIFFEQAITVLSSHEPDPVDEPRKVLMLMDEIHILGTLDVMANAFTLLRGFNVRIMAIVQNIEALDIVYDKAVRNTILSNCAHQIFYGTNNLETKRYVSKSCGEKMVKSKSISRGAGFSAERGKVSISEKPVPLIKEQQVHTLPKNKEVIITENSHPVKCNKIFYYKEKIFKDRLLPPAETPTLDIKPITAPKYDLPKKEEKTYSKKSGASKGNAQYKHGVKVSNDDEPADIEESITNDGLDNFEAL